MKTRIWELDAFRGLCVMGMVTVHLIYDVVDLYRLVRWDYPDAFLFVQNWGGVLFLLISGICATLGSRSVRRGLIVLFCGTVVSAVTVGMYLLRFSGPEIIIYFGVLQCLGFCMILWHFFRKLPTPAIAAVALILIAGGLCLLEIRVDFCWLLPLGFIPEGFQSADYFPLSHFLGFFLLGAVLGRTLYREKKSLLPGADPNNAVVRFLSFFGKHALLIYMLHQPVLAGLVGLIAMAI